MLFSYLKKKVTNQIKSACFQRSNSTLFDVSMTNYLKNKQKYVYTHIIAEMFELKLI
jgi:hypothetical protein